MTIKHIQDTIEDLCMEVARESYDKRDDIYKAAEILTTESGYHPGDDVDIVEDFIQDQLREIVKQKMEGK